VDPDLQPTSHLSLNALLPNEVTIRSDNLKTLDVLDELQIQAIAFYS
jgi:hypothetical protein